jgi:cytidylate kinase
MNTVAELKAFLDAMSYRETHPVKPDVRMGRFPFVTISRQTGAGGHSLAEALLGAIRQEREALFHGWQMFDHELCKQLVQDPKLHVSMQALLTEEYHSQIEDLLFNMMLGDTPQDIVVKKIFQTVRTLATVGKAIIVGRTGACITRGLLLGVHVRLVASEPSRIRRMMQLLRVSEQEAREVVQKQDRDRARLVRDYFHRDINDPLLYDVTWNTDTVSLEAIAGSLITLIKDKVQRQQMRTSPVAREPLRQATQEGANAVFEVR